MSREVLRHRAWFASAAVVALALVLAAILAGPSIVFSSDLGTPASPNAFWRIALSIAVVALGLASGVAILATVRAWTTTAAALDELARAARRVTEEHDFTVRLPAGSRDELNHVTEAFNLMLSEIEARDSERLRAQLDLERRLNERSTHLLREIDDKLRVKESLGRTEEQLRQAVKMEAVGRLAGGVAHDFNNLLTAILGYSQLLLRRMTVDDPLRGTVQEIQRAGERAAGLTRQLLVFSRKQTVEPRLVDLNQIVSNLDRMLRRLIGEDVELVTTLQRDLGLVRVDPGQIEQVLVNLVVNARDAMPAGGRLTISTSAVDFDAADGTIAHGRDARCHHVMLSVRDTGCGMDRTTRQHLFEPFFTTKSEGEGTGLGLSTAYGIVKQAGGHIEVESEAGQGSTFRVILPKADGTGAREATATEVPAAVADGHETILLVEDDRLVRQLAGSILRQAGYHVLEADGPDGALTSARNHPGSIDLVVTDVVMPRMNGCEMFDLLTRERPGLRGLFMSGYTDAPQRTGGVDFTGRPFLQKPFRPDDLARRVRETLQGSPPDADAAQEPATHLPI